MLNCVKTVMKSFVQTETLCNVTQCSVADSFFMGNVGCKGRCVIILCVQKPSEGHLKWRKRKNKGFCSDAFGNIPTQPFM